MTQTDSLQCNAPASGRASSPLQEVVIRGGLALQAEDCAVRAAVHHRGEHGGLVRMPNERYYQFIIWRAILPTWHAEIEREDGRDLILRRGDESHYFEMKKWFGASGNAELPGMRRDIQRLQRDPNGYLLVMAVNPLASTVQNLDDLPVALGNLQAEAREDFRFRTQNLRGEEVEFWIAGWPVLRS